MHIIVDADPIVYRSGFAAETHNYEVFYENEEGEMISKYFARDTETTAGDKKKAWAKENPEWTQMDQQRIVEAEPVAFCLNGVKLAMNACVADIERETKLKATQVTVLLSGPDNFREKLATIKEYKGNREPDYKPTHYQAIRDYLGRRFDAIVIHGREADDEVSILARADEGVTVVATIDKDLDQVPGMHYDYAKKVLYEVAPREAMLCFFTQLLAGDTVDNIQGLFRVGVGKAEKLLVAWEKEAGDTRLQDHWWTQTVKEYDANIKKYPDKYPEGMTGEEAALETARLVYMQQYEGQLWTPPGQPDATLDDID